jgi:hypothetical protein
MIKFLLERIAPVHIDTESIRYLYIQILNFHYCSLIHALRRSVTFEYLQSTSHQMSCSSVHHIYSSACICIYIYTHMHSSVCIFMYYFFLLFIFSVVSICVRNYQSKLSFFMCYQYISNSSFFFSLCRLGTLQTNFSYNFRKRKLSEYVAKEHVVHFHRYLRTENFLF